MPTNIWLRGLVYYYRHKPRGRGEINYSLRTRRLDVAKRRAAGFISKVHVMEADRAIARCLLAQFARADSGIEIELKREFPTIYARVEHQKLISEWMSEFLKIKGSGRNPILYATDRQYAHTIRMLIEVVGDKPMNHVSISDIEKYIEVISAGDDDDEAPSGIEGFSIHQDTGNSGVLNSPGHEDLAASFLLMPLAARRLNSCMGHHVATSDI